MSFSEQKPIKLYVSSKSKYKTKKQIIESLEENPKQLIFSSFSSNVKSKLPIYLDLLFGSNEDYSIVHWQKHSAKTDFEIYSSDQKIVNVHFEDGKFVLKEKSNFYKLNKLRFIMGKDEKQEIEKKDLKKANFNYKKNEFKID